MRFYEYGDPCLPHVMLIHGAGWSYWLYLQQARMLQDRYHIILPVLDGHGEEAHVPYSSTEDTVDQLVEYIDKHCGGRLFAVSGVSLGGQVVVELLSRRPDIARKAVIESGLCIPQPGLRRFSRAVTRLFGRWMFSRRFNAFLLKFMPKNLRLPGEIEALYLRDLPTMTLQNLLRIYDTYFLYQVKNGLMDSRADIQYWYGSREAGCIKASGRWFREHIGACQVVCLEGYRHSEISAYHPEEWVARADAFFKGP